MERLNELILQKNSRICAGLDPVWEEIPKSFKASIISKMQEDNSEIEIVEEAVYDEIIYNYCLSYIDAVADVVPAIKINIAFFEKEGIEDIFWEVAEYAKEKGVFVIADVKRADIGSTSKAYAETYLCEDSPFDAITINPYFGTDGVEPFFKLAKETGKGVFVLVKTSNKSSAEIQDLKLEDGRYVYEAVADKLVEWKKEIEPNRYIDGYSMIGAVVGATYREQAVKLAGRTGKTFFLVPGYGAQGATASDVAVNFDWQGLGAIVNSSRGIMQAYKKDCWKDKYSEETWKEAAHAEAERATVEINKAINRYFERNRVK